MSLSLATGEVPSLDYVLRTILSDAEVKLATYGRDQGRRGDRAFADLVRTKKDLERGLVAPAWFTEKLGSLLKDIPSNGAKCACCGFEGLVNIRRKDGVIVGPECFVHPVWTCRGARA